MAGPEKKIFSSTGYFEFPSARIAEIVYNSFAHDQLTSRFKYTQTLELEGNRIKFSTTGDTEKTMNKSVQGIIGSINLSREVICAASKYGGNLSEDEKAGISNPIEVIFT